MTQIAIKNAVQKTWPHVVSTGCFFHLQQSIIRKLKTLPLPNAPGSLYTLYSSDLVFQEMMHCYVALAFLPPANIVQYAQSLYMHSTQTARVFGKWFIENYVGVNARYLPAFWSVYGVIVQGIAKTQVTIVPKCSISKLFTNKFSGLS
jgi:hypothetical protein